MQEYLIYLACYGAFVIFVILVQVLIAAQQVGLSTLAGNREALTLTGLAGRMERAANNSLLALALVAPAVGMIHVAGTAPDLANLLLLTFLVARIFYVALYALGVTWLRTAAWMVAFLSNALLYLQLLL
ncbi:MAG: MAPEG family protein [Marivita sp.]|uniref:MAPEG family protein n=1 Tax=Marivita sp. TaxID=2003365 RepID=UPI003EF3F7E7